MSLLPSDLSPSRERISALFNEARDYLSTPIQLKTAAYVILELVVEVLSAVPSEDNNALNLIESNLEEFYEMVHSDLPPSIEVHNALHSFVTEYNNFHIVGRETEAEAELIWAALSAGTNIAVGIGVGRISESRFALHALFVGTEGLFGEEAALEILQIWWNRTFARLAFIQPEEESGD